MPGASPGFCLRCFPVIIFSTAWARSSRAGTTHLVALVDSRSDWSVSAWRKGCGRLAVRARRCAGRVREKRGRPSSLPAGGDTAGSVEVSASFRVGNPIRRVPWISWPDRECHNPVILGRSQISAVAPSAPGNSSRNLSVVDHTATRSIAPTSPRIPEPPLSQGCRQSSDPWPRTVTQIVHAPPPVQALLAQPWRAAKHRSISALPPLARLALAPCPISPLFTGIHGLRHPCCPQRAADPPAPSLPAYGTHIGAPPDY
jgi:hypothetical protein